MFINKMLILWISNNDGLLVSCRDSVIKQQGPGVNNDAIIIRAKEFKFCNSFSVDS